MYFPHGLLPLSEKIKKQIQELPLDKMKEAIVRFGLESSLKAFEERMILLRKISRKQETTHYECSDFFISKKRKHKKIN